jgi:outer membrane protein TolC
MRALLLAAGWSGVLAGLAGAQELRRVTLAEALVLAAQTQPAMVAARQDIRVANAQERQTAATFLPSLTTNLNTSRSGGARATQFGSPATVTSFYNSRLSLSANWELFTGFRRGAQRTAARATSEQRDATLLRQEYAIALATKQAFFLALANRELVGVSETRLRRAQEQLNLVSERLRLGATTRSDSLRARVEYGNAQLQLVEAQSNLRTAQANLSRAVGVAGLVDAAPDTALEARIAALDTVAVRREALANAPSIREADATVAAAQAQTRVSRAAYMPSVSLAASNSWLAGIQGGVQYTAFDTLRRPTDSIIVSPTNTPFGGRYVSGWTVSLGVSFPIFNNLTRETNAITSDAALRSAEARARDARLLLDANLTQAFAALEAAASRIDIARISLTAAEEDLRLQRERYRLGASTIFEVLTSQVAADQAQVDLVRARYDYLVARAQLEAYVGHSL